MKLKIITSANIKKVEADFNEWQKTVDIKTIHHTSIIGNRVEKSVQESRGLLTAKEKHEYILTIFYED